MIRRLALFASIACLGACSTANVAVNKRFDFTRIKRVAVISFADAPRRTGSGEIAAGAFEQALLKAGYDVIERAQVDKIVQERHIPKPINAKAAQALGQILGVDAMIFGQITDFAEPRERVVKVDVVDEHLDPIYRRRRRRVEQNGVSTDVEETVIDGYKTTRVVRKEPRTFTVDGRLGLAARMVSVATGELVWSGSDSARALTFEDAARDLADGILKAVRQTWPAAPGK